MKSKIIPILFFLIYFFIGCRDGSVKTELELSGTIEVTDINSNMSKGDTITKIDQETPLLQKKQAEAKIEFNQAEYNLSVRGFRSKDIKSATVVVDSNGNKKFVGKVIYVSSATKFTPKNIQTKKDRLKQVFGVKHEKGKTKFKKCLKNILEVTNEK